MVRCRPCDRFGKATAWLILQAIDRWAGGSGLEEGGTSDAATLERRGEGERLQRAFVGNTGEMVETDADHVPLFAALTTYFR